MVEKELVRDSNSLRDNFLTLINTKDIMNKVEIQQNFDLVFVYVGIHEGGKRLRFSHSTSTPNIIIKYYDIIKKRGLYLNV